jgi:hypothetical protein
VVRLSSAKGGCEFRCATEQSNTHNADSRAILAPPVGLKASLNKYELDLLHQRSLEARREKVKRGEPVVGSPAGYMNPRATWKSTRIEWYEKRFPWCSTSSSNWAPSVKP